MNSEIQQIKIKLDVPREVIEYYQLEQQWENEGGSIPKNQDAELEQEFKIPLKPGFCYYVVDGRFAVEENDLLYIAEIQADDYG